MKIQIYCSKCNKLEIVEKSDSNLSRTQDNVKSAIPVPGIKNGLTTYSIVHADHTLIVDIDAEGNVRGEKTINRIDHKIENILAAISSKILNYLELKSKEPISLIIITNNISLRKTLLSIFHQIIFNINENLIGLLSIAKDQVILELDVVTVYVGKWQNKINNLISGESSFIFDINNYNYVAVIEQINKAYKSYDQSNFAMLYKNDFLKSEIAKMTIKDLINQIPSLQILDMTNPINTATSLLSVLDTSVTNHLVKNY